MNNFLCKKHVQGSGRVELLRHVLLRNEEFVAEIIKGGLHISLMAEFLSGDGCLYDCMVLCSEETHHNWCPLTKDLREFSLQWFSALFFARPQCRQQVFFQCMCGGGQGDT